MAKEFAKQFYQSKNWKVVRQSVYDDANGLCNICGNRGQIVHHIIWLTPKNINNPYITLNKDNLELVCRECHARIHEGTDATREDVMFDEEGNLIGIRGNNKQQCV